MDCHFSTTLLIFNCLKIMAMHKYPYKISPIILMVPLILVLKFQ